MFDQNMQDMIMGMGVWGTSSRHETKVHVAVNVPALKARTIADGIDEANIRAEKRAEQKILDAAFQAKIQNRLDLLKE